MPVTIFFHDECPRIGSGMRRVNLISCGYKWARIECAATGARARLRRAIWDAVSKTNRKALQYEPTKDERQIDLCDLIK